MVVIHAQFHAWIQNICQHTVHLSTLNRFLTAVEVRTERWLHSFETENAGKYLLEKFLARSLSLSLFVQSLLQIFMFSYVFEYVCAFYCRLGDDDGKLIPNCEYF